MLFGAVGLVQADSVFGHPNSHSQVGRQGTKNNTLNRALDGQANRANRKKVTNKTATPMPKAWVDRGRVLFRADCSSCHGPGGNGSLSAPRLREPSGVESTFHTEPALEAYIQAHMPGDHPGSLTRPDLKYVSAYVWHIARAK